MKTSLFTPSILDFNDEIIINEAQRKFITSVSRANAYQLEKQGGFPKRIKQDNNTNGWKLSEILHWIRTLPTITHRQVGENND